MDRLDIGDDQLLNIHHEFGKKLSLGENNKSMFDDAIYSVLIEKEECYLCTRRERTFLPLPHRRSSIFFKNVK